MCYTHPFPQVLHFRPADFAPILLWILAAGGCGPAVMRHPVLELKLTLRELSLAEVDLHLAHIPDDYVRQTEEELDTAEMNRMFQRGYALARGGKPWSRITPGSTAETAIC